jgi:hypothetical protein
MANSALQTPTEEPIRKLIIFILRAYLSRGPPSDPAKLWR